MQPECYVEYRDWPLGEGVSGCKPTLVISFDELFDALVCASAILDYRDAGRLTLILHDRAMNNSHTDERARISWLDKSEAEIDDDEEYD